MTQMPGLVLPAEHSPRPIVDNALMLSSHYLAIRLLHVGCVAFSGTLFTARGLMRIADLRPSPSLGSSLAAIQHSKRSFGRPPLPIRAERP
jgi:hypothetical protein